VESPNGYETVSNFIVTESEPELSEVVANDSSFKTIWDTEGIGIEGESKTKYIMLDLEFLKIHNTKKITMRFHYHGDKTVLTLLMITTFAAIVCIIYTNNL